MLRFAYTILYVPDVEVTIDFYERAFGFRRKFIAPGGQYGKLITGDTTLSFASTILAAANLKNGFMESNIMNKTFAMEVAFTTQDVAGSYNKALEAGALAEAAPANKPHGQTVAYIRDINGFLVALCTPIE